MAVPVEEAIAALSTFSLENTLIQEGKDMTSVLYTYRSCVKALPQLPDSMKQSQADLYLETYRVLDLEMSRLRDIQRWQVSAASKLAADMQRFSRPERRSMALLSMLKLLDVLVQLDHLKNAKASIPNDFSWYKSVEDILQVLIVFAVESLELDFALLFPERHILLRVLPALVVLATSSEKDSESLYKRVKINRLINIFKNDPVIPAFPDLHLSPAAILKELSILAYQVSNACVLVFRQQLVLLKSIDGVDIEWCKEVKGNIYDMVVEGFQLLSRWTAAFGEQCAWKFSRPCKDPVPTESHDTSASFSDYEKLMHYGKQSMAVQDFVQNTLATMLWTTFRKKKDLSRILSDMRTLSADWMANTSKPESELQPLQYGGEESKGNFFYPRPVAPTAAQVHCLQFLIYEVVSGGNLRKPGETVATLTDLGFLWFREFYLESSRVIQFPVECSLPWMLMDHMIESQNAGLLESVLMPFDIYNDSAQQALVILKQRFLYDEIEAEVDHCFDIFVSKLRETIFTYYKSWAASELLDPSFLFALDNGEKFSVQPMRFTALLKMTRVKLLGRAINLRSLIAERMNKVFRENIEFLFDRFESQDLCAIVLAHELLSRDLSIDSFNLMLSEMQEKISLVSYSSRLASQIWTEMQNDFLPNFTLCNTTQRFVRSSKVPLAPVQKPSIPYAKANFYCGTQDLNSAHQSFARLHSGFFGIPHMFSIVRLLGSRSLPWLIRALLDHVSNKITTLEPMITGLQHALPKSIGVLPFDGRREVDITHFMQTAPWLGLIPGADGQILQSQDGGDSPITLFKSATSAGVSCPGFANPTAFYTISKQAEAADLLYKANMNTGSVLEYALAFTSAALDKYCTKWSAAPKTGFIDITTSKDFYRIFSGLQIEYLEGSVQVSPSNHEVLGDSVAWGGCTIIYLLGQQLHFELFDFSYQVLNVAEVEAAPIMHTQKYAHSVQGWEALLEAMKKARRLNNHVFSMLKARCPLEDKQACAIKQSGAPLHRIKFENTVSAFETRQQKGS
ncbi:Protein PIR [Camellia lanceoleosa]|uniref:Protein PIR n=1 Tax=Camellia lanceoleosa TaxID=1840588 RepID=A0ACC0J4K7_9ERIC|nr:Protein PIR [Camellia lanceoleosa]